MTELQQAVIEQLGYTITDFESETPEHNELLSNLDDVTKHGADTGWSGFTYYSDTIEFTRKNRESISELIRDFAAEIGQNAVEFIMSFRCLNRSSQEEVEAAGRFVYGAPYCESEKCDSDTVYNALAWFALEEVARQLTDN